MSEEQYEQQRAKRKARSALYYQRNRETIKLAWSLSIPMREARRLTGKHGRWQNRAEMEICSDWRLSNT